ncbi:MAG: carotenoid biosynthesis protein, partial [Gemmataceae bacterium]
TSWAVADRLTDGSRDLDFLLFAALAATVWDLLIDPVFTHWKVWIWTHPRGYFGIPWSNYLGWFVVTAVMTALLQPTTFSATPLLWLYTVSWAFGTIALLTTQGARGSAVVGGLVMGVMVVAAWAS